MPLHDHVRQLARQPNFGTLTTLLPSGHPATQVVWIDADDDCLIVNTEVGRQKYSNVQSDPRVTVCIWDNNDPYNYAEIRGTVVETVGGQRAREHIDECAQRYFGHDFDPNNIENERVMLYIAPLPRR